MTEAETRSGRCMCGAITYEAAEPLRPVLHCHCVHCRRFSGNYSASTGCPTADLAVSGELSWYDHGYAKYAFCGDCGSSLFWVGVDRPELTSIKIGTLDDATGLELTGIWFAAEAQPHVLLDDAVPHFAGNDD